MTVKHFEGLLDAFLSRRPFRVFTVELHNGNRIEVDHPLAVAYRDGHAIFAGPGYVQVYFDHEGVVQIIDAPSSDAPRKAEAARPLNRTTAQVDSWQISPDVLYRASGERFRCASSTTPCSSYFSFGSSQIARRRWAIASLQLTRS